MNGVLSFISNFFQQPSILIGLIALIGLLLQKKSASETVQGTIKTFAGFLVLSAGSGVLVNALTPFTAMFQHIFNVRGIVPTNEGVVALALVKYGSTAALIMLVGMIVNILLARFTRFKYIFLTGQAMLYMSSLAAIVLATAGFGQSWMTVLLGGLFEGTIFTVTPALTQPFMRKITGTDAVAMGHTGNMGYAISGAMGKVWGNKDSKEKSTENLKVPQGLTFLRDSTVSIVIIMAIIYVVLALISGPTFVESKALSGGTNYIIYALVQAGTFAAGFVIVLQGVRMILAEIVPAFQGIANKLVPNSKPALDVPIIFPYAPNALIIGFFVSFVVSALSMGVMIAIHTTIIIPGVVGCFFCGGAAAIYGNAFGGRRGAILGSALNGLFFSWLPLLFLPSAGAFQAGAGATFADTDYLVPGIIMGQASKAGLWLVVTIIILFFVLVILSSILLNARDKAKLAAGKDPETTQA